MIQTSGQARQLGHDGDGLLVALQHVIRYSFHLAAIFGQEGVLLLGALLYFQRLLALAEKDLQLPGPADDVKWCVHHLSAPRLCGRASDMAGSRSALRRRRSDETYGRHGICDQTGRSPLTVVRCM